MVEIVFLGINEVGEWIYNWLTERNDANVLALLTERGQLPVVKKLDPNLLISAGFRHIVPEDILQIPNLGAVNLHKSYLPYNRGANPNVWSIIEDTPVGVSIHYMTNDIDAGPIIDRRKVPMEPDDTALNLYERLEEAQIEQFKDVWPLIREGTAQTTNQDPKEGSYHRKRDFVELWKLNLSQTTKVGDLIDRLRALTFPPYRNAYFEKNGEKYYVDIQITKENDRKTQKYSLKKKKPPQYSEDNYLDNS